MSKMIFTRRRVLKSSRLLVTASPLMEGRHLTGDPPTRLAPREELVNVLEFEAMARLKLSSTIYSTIAGGDRRAFDLMTFRPRRMINSMNLDLTTELFGESMFSPILVGPMAQQQQFHSEGELATVRGASAANTTVVISSRSSYPIDQVANQAKITLWYQVYPEPDVAFVRKQVQRAVEVGCKAVCITVGTSYQSAGVEGREIDWRVIDQIRQEVSVPVLLKGIMTQEEARAAINREIQGIIVSNYGERFGSGPVSPIESLSSIVDVVARRVPVLIDGNFRRGSDILKALALGADAVLLGRPTIWGLAAYGADGVQTVLELLQSELARSMAGSGRPNIKSLDRTLVRIHSR